MALLSDHAASVQLAKVLMHPPIRFYLNLNANPLFAQGVDEIAQKSWHNLFYGEFGLFLVIGFLRHWRMGKTSQWHRHMWTRLWTFTLFWVLALTAVPLVVYGESYVLILHGLAGTILDFIR